MNKRDDDLVGVLFHDIAHLIRLRIDQSLRPYDLTRVAWVAICILQRNGALSQAELAEALELGAAATGKLVDRLEDKGLVIRQPDPEDRRVNQLGLTPKAKALIRKVQPISAEIRDEVLSGLSDEELEDLGGTLKAIKKRLRSEKLANS